MNIFELLGGGIGDTLGRGMRRSLPLTAEDDAIVNTNRGRMPLNMVEGDIQRLPNPPRVGADFGLFDILGSRFSPSLRAEIPSQTPGIDGAISPYSQIRRGRTPSSIGEGPRTNFNSYR